MTEVFIEKMTLEQSLEGGKRATRQISGEKALIKSRYNSCMIKFTLLKYIVQFNRKIKFFRED